MTVKICGIMNVADGFAAAKYGATAIGFVFAESKRKITADEAKEIISHLPKDVMKVGVFVNETKNEIERIASIAGLTHIQLHGEETASFSKSLPLPVIKAVSFQDNNQLKQMLDFPCDYLLLDGPKGQYRGGNGTSFSWGEVDCAILNEKKVILAGGLHEGNVEKAIKIIKPVMVDVSSGVETDGVKDVTKIKTFIEKVKEAI